MLHEMLQWGFQTQHLKEQAMLMRQQMIPEQLTIFDLTIFDCIVDARGVQRRPKSDYAHFIITL